MNSPVTVVILAAGLGTRMKSKLVKVLHRAGGLTVVEHVVRTAQTQARPEAICVVVGHQAEQVRATLQPYGVGFAFQNEPKGTGHAVSCWAESAVQRSGWVVILYGDCPLLTPATLARLLQAQTSANHAATVITANVADPTGYGRIVRSADGFVDAIVEQKAASAEQQAIREINSGIYCFQADLLCSALKRLRPNPASGELYLTDVVELLHEEGHRMVPLVLEDVDQLLGINTRVELAYADRMLRERKARELMFAGVTIEKPETVTIDADVQVGEDSIIGPFTHLLGKTTVGADCVIGAGSVLKDATLESGVELSPYTIIKDSQVGQAATIGPFAHLRMNNEVDAKAHIGNFVELKKTKLGQGSKAGHLAYLGDAAIGSGVNIGAGTITCNYDGQHKHTTTIGQGSFVGSNSTLVAPVEVGEESYVGAGSVITDAVPPSALALGRSRQVIKPEWAAKRRKERKQK